MPTRNDSRVNILLVDDQPSRLLSYEAILEQLGENLVRAGSGEEALRRLMERDYAVILLDVSMPGMDGFETAQMVHQHPRFERTPIIFVTGVHLDELDRLEGYKLGAIDYVQVPVIPEMLRSKVAVLVELYRKRRELELVNRSLEGQNAELMQANLDLQTEKAREFESLSHILAQANTELSSTNQALEGEIVERRRAEDHMRFLADQLRETDRRKDEFLATLAHELRNPLAPIRSALGILQHPDHDREDALRAQAIIDRQVRQMVRLVDDLLDVSRITRDRLELRKQRIGLAGVVNAAVETTMPQLRALGHRLQVELPEAPMLIDGDPQRLSQVFGNLLNNACKYTARGGQVRLQAQIVDGWVHVAVSDTGIGLQSHQLQAVFDLLVQVDTSLERAQGGLGIGLTLVRRLVEMHGGNVAARSDGPGKGSTFEVSLPLVGVESRSEPAKPTTRASATRSQRILIVDDNRDAADMLSLSLQLLGHDIRTLYDPEQVIGMLAEFAPDLAFIDVGMPKLNGFELARQIRATPEGEGICLVALTGWGQEEDRRRSREAGFDEHLVKPADPGDIERVCRQPLRVRQVAASTP